MVQIVPTVTASDRNTFSQQFDNISFAERVHLDFTDGIFAKPQSYPLELAYWQPETSQVVDVHLMLQDPNSAIETAIAKGSNLVIIHAEADTFHDAFVKLEKLQVPVGVAILPETTIGDVAEYIARSQHVLIFGGKLGSQGGKADLEQLGKIADIRAISPSVEIAWDGGANIDNLEQLVAAGIDVVNVGSSIHKAKETEDAYNQLHKLANYH